MAKWGEGDPRWIVEERADATNVNNWHWTEKKATNWSKDKLKSLLIGLQIDGAAGVVELKSFTTLEGEASASNRKSKLIFFYEWDIKINWKGTLNTEDMAEVNGSITIPNLSDEQEVSDIQVDVTVKDNKPGADMLKEMIRTKGADMIREKLASYIDLLKQEFSKGMILPTSTQDSAASTAITGTTATTRTTAAETKNTNNLTNEFKQTSLNARVSPSNPCASKSGGGGIKINTKKISMKEEFMCSKEELYRTLTEKQMVQAFTRAPVAKWELEVGGQFVLFGGMITGEFQQLTPHDTIIQRWRMKNWPDGHFSVVTLKISQTSNCSTLTLSQTGVPASETDTTKQGWRNYYWNSIRQTFGYAVNLF